MSRNDDLEFLLEEPENKAKMIKLVLFGEVMAAIMMTIGFLYIVFWIAGWV